VHRTHQHPVLECREAQVQGREQVGIDSHGNSFR
jgi:hypothetical protein